MQLRLSRANLDDHTDLCSTTTYADLQCNLEPTEFPVGPATLFPIRDQTTTRTFLRPPLSAIWNAISEPIPDGPGNENWIREWTRE